jgi:UDP-3-O-[3-hydroxymyristoyl] N-acetylglucosamine deacetylase/3-hydroxyacyl-[acyl-carrier-protein] dehydratase
VRPSHKANTDLAKAILAQMRRPIEAAQTFTPPPPAGSAGGNAPVAAPTPPSPATPAERAPERRAPSGSASSGAGNASAVAHNPDSPDLMIRDGATLDIMQVMRLLPHRPPFLMVDRVTKIEGNKIVALKQVTMGEPHFEGHFPGHPIMPGVLQLEAMAQVAGILMMRQAENSGKLAYFMSAEDVKWRKPVRPGDSLVIEVEMTKARGKIGKARGVCSVDGETVSEANVTFMLIDR